MRISWSFVVVVACLPGVAFAQGSETVGQQGAELTAADSEHFWTSERVVPMCWHVLQFPTPAELQTAQALVTRTITEGWLSLINLDATWTDCPTSGDARYVRVLLRSGDANYNGTTLRPGTLTLSTAAERMQPPPNDPPGLLMGFPASWNQSDGDRAQFQALILHEFGHVLGFGHEQDRPDGVGGVACYTDDFPNTVKIGPPDPTSIMGWSYCDTALGQLSLEDIRGLRSVYGPRPTSNVQPTMIGILANHLLN